MTPENRPTRGGGGRRRPPPREVEVLAVRRITPRLASVTLGGAALDGFREPQPTAHIKLFLPDRAGHLARPVVAPDGTVDWPDGRPTMRTYTPRRYDAAAQTLEVQLVLHGDGVAARWAQDAAPGHRVAIGGPGPGLEVDQEGARWWIGADESALPAVGTLLDALPASARAEVHLEVEDEDDHDPDLADRPGVTVQWHHRRTPDARPADWGAHLLAAVERADLTPETHVWVACEAAAVRRVRTHLLAERALPRTRVTTRGYWRLGEADHTDHDTGED